MRRQIWQSSKKIFPNFVMRPAGCQTGENSFDFELILLGFFSIFDFHHSLTIRFQRSQMLQSVILRDRIWHFFATIGRIQTSSRSLAFGSPCRGKIGLKKICRSVLAVAAIASAVAFQPMAASAATGCGGASWYSAGSRTASGERMNASTLTAAHRSLAFGTRLKVTNRHNGRSVVVRINDRGPFIRGRVLDLSRAAAQNIGMVASGTASVCYQVVG
jgi:rare lipoprotein A